MTTFKWDSNNRLIESRKEDKITEYKYDPLGRRISKETEGKITNFYWEGNKLISDTERDYHYYPYSFEPLAMETQNKLYYYHNDINGAPLRLTDEAGNIVWNVHYDIFGKIDKLTIKEVHNPIRMQGQYEDEETGLYYNRFRYYDPNISAYVSQDPIGLLGGTNLYSYPINSFGWCDPLGLSCKKSKKTTYEGESRRDSFRQAKRDADIPQNKKPSKVEHVDLEDGYGGKVRNSDGTAVQTRNYHYTNNKGKEIVIQEHSLGHEKATPLHGQEPHFNVRPIENLKTGYVEGTHGHYNF